MSLCDFDRRPLDLELLRLLDCHVLYKIWAKSSNPRLSYWRFSTFTPCNFRGLGISTQRFSGVRGLKFTKLSRNIGRSLLHKKFVSEFRCLAEFSNAADSNLSDVETTPNFALFDPMWKLGEGCRDLYTNRWSFTYDRTSGIQLMAIHYAAVERGGLIRNKEIIDKEKERKRKFMGKA